MLRAQFGLFYVPQKFRDPALSLWLGLNLVLPALSPKGFPFCARFRQDDSAWKPPIKRHISAEARSPMPACLSWLFFLGRVLWHLGSSTGPETTSSLHPLPPDTQPQAL